MKRTTWAGMLFLLCCVGSVSADETSVLCLKTISQQQQLAVNSIVRIRYDLPDMIVELNEGDPIVSPISEVVSISFSSLPSAIQKLCAEPHVSFQICDISGKMLVEGTTDDNGQIHLPSMGSGVFIVKVGAVSQKILVR